MSTTPKDTNSGSPNDTHPLPPKAVVLLSGGLDSVTALAVAQRDGFECHALSFDYGQRHSVELQAAAQIAAAMNVASHRTATIDLRTFGGSALTDDTLDVPKDRPPEDLDSPGYDADDDIPITYVPARNTIFLSYALALAEVIGSTDLFIGVNAVDYSGYPDCRPEFIAAFQHMANLATKAGVTPGNHHSPLRVHTPLIDLPKPAIIELGLSLGVDYALTHSCYDPLGPDHIKPCGHCDSCLLRLRAFAQLGQPDPAMLRHHGPDAVS